jgi:hypothetical protein
MTEEESWGMGGAGWVVGGGGRKKRYAMRRRMKKCIFSERGIKWGRVARLVANIPRIERKRRKPDHTNR